MSYDLESIKDEYPFEPQSFDIDGVNMSYLDEGPRDAPCILMLHGNPTWSFYYRKLVLAFRDKYRVIVPDHIGCGLSDKPQEYDYSLNTHIDNLVRLIDNLGVREVNLAVHDWGGAIGFGYAQRRPEVINSFIVFNTAAFRSDHIPRRIKVCRTPLLGDIAVRGFNAFVQAAVSLGMGTGRKELFTKSVKKGYLLPYNSWSNRIAILRFVQDIPLTRKDKSYKTLTKVEESLARFQNKPALLLWGMKDFCFDERFLNEWEDRFPLKLVHKYKDAGHFVVEDAIDQIIPEIRYFLLGFE